MSTVDKQIILLTGAGRGLGLAVTKLLLQEEKNIYLLAACRSVDAGEKSIRPLLEGIDIQSNGNTLQVRFIWLLSIILLKIQIIPIDLSSPDTIRDAAKSIEWASLLSFFSLYLDTNTADSMSWSTMQPLQIETAPRRRSTSTFTEQRWWQSSLYQLTRDVADGWCLHPSPVEF